MYYWSRWASIPTTETGNDEIEEARPSWRDTAPRPVAQRETRPVVVVTRNRTQPHTTPQTYARTNAQERATDEGISLDVRRSTRTFSSATRVYPRSVRLHEATTQPVLEAFRIK